MAHDEAHMESAATNFHSLQYWNPSTESHRFLSDQFRKVSGFHLNLLMRCGFECMSFNLISMKNVKCLSSTESHFITNCHWHEMLLAESFKEQDVYCQRIIVSVTIIMRTQENKTFIILHNVNFTCYSVQLWSTVMPFTQEYAESYCQKKFSSFFLSFLSSY